MKYFQRNEQDLSGAARPGSLLSALTLALALGGCSADVGRFDFPSFNLNGGDSGATSALPTPSEPMTSTAPSFGGGGDTFSGGAYLPPSSRSRVEFAALPEPAAQPAPAPSYNSRPSSAGRYGSTPYQPPRAIYQPQAVRPVQPAPSAVAAGDTIEVRSGDTLYGLARANGVTVRDLMTANGLTNAMIRPGQTLRLPGSGSNIAAPISSAPERRTAAARPRAAVPVIVAQDWRGSYQVQPGDSLYRIARQHEIRVADLQRANSIENPRQLKPGMVLRIPGTAEPSSLPSSTVTTIPGATAPEAPRAIQSTTQPTMINGRGERRVAALNTGRITDASPAPSASWSGVKPVQTVAITPSQIGTNSLRWPSKGKVLSGFGQRADGTHNDGINIAVPKGTDVHAAAEGEVAYAGSELKGYGNLILLRHDNGWVTAYAHADQLLVKRGDKVRRGDVIAKAGNTGQVDQPQLHFELRQGSKPVDPLPYLDRL